MYHALNVCEGIIWCDKCGVLTMGKRIQHLKDRCRGYPKSGYAGIRRDRLRNKTHPYTGVPLHGDISRVRIGSLRNCDATDQEVETDSNWLDCPTTPAVLHDVRVP